MFVPFHINIVIVGYSRSKNSRVGITHILEMVN